MPLFDPCYAKPLLPESPERSPEDPGRPRIGDRQILTGTLFVLKAGIPWNALPCEMGCGCGCGKSCPRRLHAWQEVGVWYNPHRLLLGKLDDAGKIDWSRAAGPTGSGTRRGSRSAGR